MRRVNLHARVERELCLWSLFAFDAQPVHTDVMTPPRLKASLERRAALPTLRAQLERQLSAWGADVGIARLAFTHVKNKQQLQSIWESKELWTSTRESLIELSVYQSAIDALISQSSLRWKLPRMGAVDRAILRLSTYELCFKSELTARTVLNEAVELGKRYGSADSGRFINGVLDRVAQELGRVERRASSRDSETVNVIKVTRRGAKE